MIQRDTFTSSNHLELLFQVGFAEMEKTNSAIRFVIIFLIVVGSHGQTHMGKYIAKNYFDKFDRFVEREFDNFVANEIPLGLSEVIVGNPTLSSHLQRGLSGEGSHRRLSSSIGFMLQSELKSELTSHSCEVVIIERLPLGVFADPFELHRLVECDVFSGAAVFGDTNLELPSFRSDQSVVEIRMSVDSKVLSRSEGDAEVHLDLPLHARYPALGHGFSRVEFGQPDVFFCCSLDGNVPNRSCVSMAINDNTISKSSPVIWEIPCGAKEHAAVISAVTLSFAIFNAMIIVRRSICYSSRQGSNKFKLS